MRITLPSHIDIQSLRLSRSISLVDEIAVAQTSEDVILSLRGLGRDLAGPWPGLWQDRSTSFERFLIIESGLVCQGRFGPAPSGFNGASSFE